MELDATLVDGVAARALGLEGHAEAQRVGLRELDVAGRTRLGAGQPDVERMILIAPPVHTQSFEELVTCPVPKLVVQGTADEICRPENLEKVFPSWAEPKRLLRVDDASHFFDKHLADLGRALLEGIR